MAGHASRLEQIERLWQTRTHMQTSWLAVLPVQLSPVTCPGLILAGSVSRANRNKGACCLATRQLQPRMCHQARSKPVASCCCQLLVLLSTNGVSRLKGAQSWSFGRRKRSAS